MGRNTVAVVVGYLAMFAVVFVCLTGAYVAMGADRAFQPGSYDVSMLWTIVMFGVGLIAAIVGGLVCSKIATGTKAVPGLAVVVLVLGVLMAIPVLTAKQEGPPPVRDASVSSMEAMTKAQQPGWIALANPVVGVVGVLIGGSLRKKKF